MKLKKSEKLWKRALQVFPGGVNSPVRAFKSVGGNPVFVSRGKGTFITDADGNKYLDFLSSWGPLILGHAPRKVVKATRRAALNGSTFGAVTAAEVELGELITSNLEFVQKVRFVSSGTEAVMTALRLARGITKRPMVIKFEGCYHGHNDALLARAGSGLLTLSGNIAESSSPGVPDDIVRNTLVLPLDDSAALDATVKAYGDKIACVIIEPLPANAGLLPQRKAYVEYLVELCRSHKILVIFDEVISGFRLGFGGYTQREQIFPDIITYGKIIGGGLPVGAIAGSQAIMDNLAPQGPVYQAGTLSGNPLAVAAGLATLAKLDDDAYRRINVLTDRLVAGLADLAWKYPLQVASVPGLVTLFFRDTAVGDFADAVDTDLDRHAAFCRAMLDRGIYLPPAQFEAWFVSLSHDEEAVDRTLEATAESLAEVL